MGYRITKIKSHIYSSNYGNNKVFGQPKSLRSGVILEIQTKNNMSGYGETYLSGYLPELTKASFDYFCDNLIGRNLDDIHDIVLSLKIPFCTNNGFMKSIISAIEIGLYDLKSRIEKKPLYKLLNKDFRKSIKAYASGGSVIFGKNAIKDDFIKASNLDLKYYKLRIGYKNFKNDYERIKFAINLFGKNNVMVDAIMGTLNKWEKKDFLKKLKILDKLKIKWIEEPLHPSKITDYNEINKLCSIPVAIGEAYTSYEEFKTIINFNCCDIIQPDITQCGIIDTIKVCKLAKKNKKKISLHVWGSSLSFLANLHFAIAFKEVDFIEYPLVNLEIFKNEIKNKYNISNSRISINSKIDGLGFKVANNYFNRFKFIEKSGFKI
ncbi:hypothetical protein OAM09_05185 [Candidatus Pelagibacter sp.]|nr:hypothetical protein [Candidatus Pelagibacter sp.]